MAKLQLRRYIWLIDTIRSANGITFDEINRRWMRSSLNESGKELPKRTFHDHIESILEEFDIEITCDRTDGYRYRIDEYDEYGSVRKAMVDAMVLDSAVRESPEIGERIVFYDKSHSGNLPAIVQALKDRKTIRYRYRHDYSYVRQSAPGCENLKDTDYTDEITVYGLFFCGIWFMVGKVLSDHQLHIYALHRLSEIEETEREYCLPEDFDIQQYMTEYKTDISEEFLLEDDEASLEVYRVDAEPSYLL